MSGSIRRIQRYPPVQDPYYPSDLDYEGYPRTRAIRPLPEVLNPTISQRVALIEQEIDAISADQLNMDRRLTMLERGGPMGGPGCGIPPYGAPPCGPGYGCGPAPCGPGPCAAPYSYQFYSGYGAPPCGPGPCGGGGPGCGFPPGPGGCGGGGCNKKDRDCDGDDECKCNKKKR